MLFNQEKQEREMLAVVFAMLVMVLFSATMSYAGFEDSGNRIANTAKTILQPVGLVIAGYYSWQAFQTDHDRAKNIAKAIGGGLLALWDNTVNFVKYLLGF